MTSPSLLHGGTFHVCLTVVHHNLGAADVLLDYAEGLLVLRPTLAPAERLAAARRILDAAGVEQVGHGVTCRCGEPLRVPGCDDRAGRRNAVRGLAATAVVAVAATAIAFPSSAAADHTFDTPSWHATVDELNLDCTYDSDHAGTCISPTLGRVHVSVDPAPPFADTEYAIVGQDETAYVWRFGSPADRDRFVDRYPRDAVPIAERGALHQ